MIYLNLCVYVFFCIFYYVTNRSPIVKNATNTNLLPLENSELLLYKGLINQCRKLMVSYFTIYSISSSQNI